MTLLERKVNALARAMLARDPVNKSRALEELSQLMQTKSERYQDVDAAVRASLLELGVPERILGYERLVLAISLVVEDKNLTNSMTKTLYPMVADMLQTTKSGTERGIRHAIEVCWDRMDLDTMQTYFGNTVSPLKGKPTNGEFIARVARAVRERMKGVQ